MEQILILICIFRSIIYTIKYCFPFKYGFSWFFNYKIWVDGHDYMLEDDKCICQTCGYIDE